MWFMFRSNPVKTTSVTCTTRNPTQASIIRKWMERAPCLPPNMRGNHGKWFTIAGDIAAPATIEMGAKMKTTKK